MLKDRSTLTQFLIEQRRRHPESTGDLNALLHDVALACKAVSRRIATGAFTGALGLAGAVNARGEQRQRLDILSNDIFLRANEWNGQVAGMMSQELPEPFQIPSEFPCGKYLLTFDPMDGSTNVDVNLSMGSIFSILRAPAPGVPASPEDFLQAGARQVAAGYAIYGPSTVLVLTVGTGVHAFTLDSELGEFFLTRENIRLPESASLFAVNSSNRRFWERPVRRYVDECLAGVAGPRGKDFNMHWAASLVAETHRILNRGGVFLDPRDTTDPARAGRSRLLDEANPIAFLVEQAGGLATTGHTPILQVQPSHLHQRVPFIFGSRDEVERVTRYHVEPDGGDQSNPLYRHRGLFRVTSF